MMYATDAQRIIAPGLVGLPVSDLVAMYGDPVSIQAQEGHRVYYWQKVTGFAYQEQYTATTQGTVGYGSGVPFNSTTTLQGPVTTGVVPCELAAGIALDGSTVERVQFRGADCEAFAHH